MDWIRRNWPDLLIGFALLAVISGIVATLLTGGSFFSSRDSSPSREAPQQVAETQDAGRSEAEPGREDGAGTEDTLPGADRTGGGEDEPVDPFAELAELEEQEAADESAAAEAPPEAEQEELPAVVALRPGAPVEADEETEGGGGDAAAEPAGAEEAAGAAEAEAGGSPAESAAADPETDSADSSPAAAVSAGTAPSQAEPYTVGVGAFRTAENAEAQAGVFRQAGFPVILAAQDELSVVLLGPYANRTEAERVRDSVNDGGFDVSAIVYTYQGAGDSTAAAEGAPSTGAPAAPAETDGAADRGGEPAETASAATGNRYLQVGAYSSDGNAAAQREILEELGYGVVERQDGNLIRILVGPYPDGELTDAQDRLAGQGIDSVPY